MRFGRALLALGVTAMLTSAAMAQDSGKLLTIGTAQETSSLYPNWFVSTPNQQIASHIFEPLVKMSVDNRPEPDLAVSWKAVDPQTWEFKLRKGVTFSDGTPFNADSVIASFKHSETIKGNGSSGGAYVSDKKYWKVDDYTIRIASKKPDPLLPNEMSVVYIYEKPAPVDDFNSGKAAIGTGPYKLVEWVRGDHLTLERNDKYWGKKPEWTRVIFKPIASDSTRVAALLNGDVDVIDRVPTADVKRLKSNPKINVVSRPGERIIYLQLDVSRDLSPYVTDVKTGKPLWPNPLRQWKVRKALSEAINRDAIVSRIMDGQAVAAGQIAAPGMFGYNPNLKPDKYDPKEAKKLIAEAGYPDGFGITLHSSDGRYINDASIAQAIAQMWTRIGVKTKVVTMPPSTYFSNRDHGGKYGVPEYSAILGGFGTSTGETMSQDWMLLHTTNVDESLGHANYGRYSNMRLDAFLEQAMKTVDDKKREAMLQELGKDYMADYALIPLHWQVNVWAMRKGLTLDPSLMEVTHAMRIHSVK